MILDTLENANRYAALHPLFPAAFAFLRDLDPASVEPGTVPIQGEDLFAIVARQDSVPPGSDSVSSSSSLSVSSSSSSSPSVPLRLEAHRRYIDLQAALEGGFSIGWRALRDCRNVDATYSEEKDIVFFSDPVDCVFPIVEGDFAILYPEDAHAPGPATRPLLKVVFKIAVTPGD